VVERLLPKQDIVGPLKTYPYIQKIHRLFGTYPPYKAVILSTKTITTQAWSLTSYKLQDAYTDFVLSRQAMRVSKTTIEFYRYTAGFFAHWLESQAVTEPREVTARHVRAYLAELVGRELSEWTCNGHARAIKTLVRFWHEEGYLPTAIKFEMPKVSKKRMTVLSADDVTNVLKNCTKREKAVLLLMVDTGMRRAETTALNWGDVDIDTGLIQVKNGKGGKARSVVIGATTRRALLAYRRTQTTTGDKAAVIQTDEGQRFAGEGLYQLFKRFSKRAGVKFTPHALRRTFTILSLRAGMSPLHLQNLLGHSSLDMVQWYAQMIDDDLLQAHNEHSPIDNLARLKR
jgi:integrase/recombinase XerD